MENWWRAAPLFLGHLVQGCCRIGGGLPPLFLENRWSATAVLSVGLSCCRVGGTSYTDLVLGWSTSACCSSVDLVAAAGAGAADLHLYQYCRTA